MTHIPAEPLTFEDLQARYEAVQARLEAAEEALRAIQSGEVDALVISTEEGEQIYTLEGADYTYRVMVETISEGVANLTDEGILLYSNQRLADMLGVPLESLLGSSLFRFIPPSSWPIYHSLLQRAQTKSSQREITLQRGDGACIPALFSLSRAESKGQRMLCLVVTDLTEQKRSEEILAAERLARSILEQASEAIVVCDGQGTIIRASQAAFKLALENPLFQPFESVFRFVSAGGESPHESFSIASVLQGRDYQGVEVWLELPGSGPTGGPCLGCLLLSATPLRNERDDILGCIISITDITGRKQAEQALRESEEHFRLALQNMPVVVSTLDRDLRYTWVYNPQGGYRPDEVIGKPVGYSADPQAAQAMHESLQEVVENGETTQWESVSHTPAGEKVLQTHAEPLRSEAGEVTGVALVAIDITEHKQAEQRIAAEKEWFRTTLTSIGDAVITTDPDGKITFLNPVAERLTGWTNPEAAGLPLAQVLPIINEQTRQPIENPVAKVVQTGRVVGLANHTALISRADRIIPIEDSAAPIWDAKGLLLGVIMVFHDVSQKRKAETTLRESRDRLLQTTEAAEIGLWDWDIQSGSLTWDERCRDMFDIPAEARVTYPVFLQAVHPEDRQGVDEATQAALAAHTILRAEYRIVWSDGSLHWIYTRGQAVYDEAGNPTQMFGVLMDISDRKAIEAEIQSNQARLEVQRRLIEQRELERQQIARDLHDGPVQALLAMTFALNGLRKGSCTAEVSQALEQIEGSLQEQVNELRAYAGELRPPILSKFGLAKAIRSHLESFQAKHPGMQFHFEEASAGPLLSEPMRVTLYRIYQESLANIVRHAQASDVTIRLAKMEQQASLDIQDNGVGFAVPSDWLDLARHGHLGLVGMRERAEAVGGSLAVDSQPGQGTRIQVVVPIQMQRDP